MRKTLETVWTPSLRLDELEGGSDRVGRRVGGAGDHPVGEAEVHHHRAEVGHVGDDLAGPLERHPLVRPEPGVLRGEPLHELRVRRRDDGGLVQVQPEHRGPGADGILLTEQGQPRHAAAQQDGGGLEDPVVAALRQHDVLAVGPGPLHQLVLEHQRCAHVGGRHVDGVEQGRGVDAARRTAAAPSRSCWSRPCVIGPVTDRQPLGRR